MQFTPRALPNGGKRTAEKMSLQTSVRKLAVKVVNCTVKFTFS